MTKPAKVVIYAGDADVKVIVTTPQRSYPYVVAAGKTHTLNIPPGHSVRVIPNKSTSPTTLAQYRSAYLDWREGDLDEPPSTDKLNDEDRSVAHGWIQSLRDAARVYPAATPPSIDELLSNRSDRNHMFYFARALQ